jgi:hypothetical protein
MYQRPVLVPVAQTAGVTETEEPEIALPVIAGALVAAAAFAGAPSPSEPPTASNNAAPMDTSFLKLIELVISSRKPKTGLKTGLKKGFTPAN